ncbi:MAG: TauD/TfdA family dioxygenase [Roseiarcus sp.]
MPRRVFSAAARLTRGPRRRWKDLVCEHMPIHSRAAIGFTQPTPEETAHIRPVRRRLVSVHPATGRKSLFLSSHAGAILGWTIPEARMFLRDLAEHATQREFVHVHRLAPRRSRDVGQPDDDAARAAGSAARRSGTCAAPRSPATRPPGNSRRREARGAC